MKLSLAISFITLSLIHSCDLAGRKNYSIVGFWECEIGIGSKKVLHFCEVTDAVFAFWSEDVNYLPPYLYSIAAGDSLFYDGVHGQSDQTSTNREFIGVISIIDSTEFQVVSDKNTIHFIKSSKERFEKVNTHNEKWLDF